MQPLAVLTFLVFIGLSTVSCFRIFQAIIVETIQQRLFVKTGLKLAKELPHIHYQTIENVNMLMSVNYFFEIPTIQKSIAMLLVTGLDLAFMGLISMLLLAFYHPLLLAFDIFLIIGLVIVILFPYRNALKYAIEESDAKHEVASWLEEIVKNLILFKMQSHDEYAFEVADRKLLRYVQERKQHFKSILKHLIGMNALYVFANAALLGSGGYLVIKEQLSLGQLVASELIVNALLYSFLRIGFYLEDFYDLLASSYKLGKLLNLPKDISQQDAKKEELELIIPSFSLSCDNVSYQGTAQRILDRLSFTIPPSDKVAVLAETGRGKSILLDVLSGLREPSTGSIKINNVPLKEFSTKLYQKNITLVRHIELLSVSIYDNLVLQNKQITKNQVYSVLDALNLTATIESFPNGLETVVAASHLDIARPELNKLMLARGILTQPNLLLIDGLLDAVPPIDIPATVKYLQSMDSTVIVATVRQDIAELFTHRILL